jgi:curved DNA-binding protein
MEDFVDYFELLQISPNAEQQTIHRVYKMLAARFHPDNVTTGDRDKFLHLQAAYQVLSDPEARATYKTEWELRRLRPLPVFEMAEFFNGMEAQAYRRLGILCLLYNQRRTTPDHPNMSLFEMEARMSIPREHLEFTTWYLREKNYLRLHDSGELSITAEGVDYVESNVSTNRVVHKLLNVGEENRQATA